MSEIITQLTGVSRTLLFTLKSRVEEQARPIPFFKDPLAVEWQKRLPLNPEMERLYSCFRSSFQTSWSTRAYYYDQVTSRHIANHAYPVVVELGAGLSTRFHRIGQEVERWLEIDLPEVTSLRYQLDRETRQHQFISASVMDFDWMNSVSDVGSENLLFLAEGLLMYLEESEVQQLVNEMKRHFSGATWVIDVIGNYGRLFRQMTAKMEAPLGWFLDNPEQDLEAMGLKVVNSTSLYELYPERWTWQWRLLLRFLTQFPYFRNAYLIVETQL